MHMNFPKALIHQGVFTNGWPIAMFTLHSSECVRFQNCSNPTTLHWLTQKVAFVTSTAPFALTGRVTDWILTYGHETSLSVSSEEHATTFISVTRYSERAVTTHDFNKKIKSHIYHLIYFETRLSNVTEPHNSIIRHSPISLTLRLIETSFLFQEANELRRVLFSSYRMAQEKPAHRLVEQRGRRSRTLYRKWNKCKCKVLTG